MNTALQWIMQLAPQNEGKRFAVSKNHDAVGVWHDDAARFIPLLVKTITDQWVHMTMEVWANGEPMYAAGQWIEVASDGVSTRPIYAAA